MQTPMSMLNKSAVTEVFIDTLIGTARPMDRQYASGCMAYR